MRCSMKLTNELFDKLQTLSQIELFGSDRERCREEIEKIITYTEFLNEVDTSDVEPLVHLFTESSQLREDEPKESLHVDKALSNSPRTADGCFCVPKAVSEVKE